MFDKYKYFFDLYLRICKRKYDPERPHDNLKECIEACDRRKQELFGMLNLLKEVKEITDEQCDAEEKRIMTEFSSIKLYNVYIQAGEAYLC